MSKKREIYSLLGSLDALAPGGYAVALHIRFTAPLFERNCYPESWQKVYYGNAYQFRDPILFWATGKSGKSRWSEISMPDPFGVMDKAREHGLIYGVVASCGKITSRSVVGVARSDREFSDSELDAVSEINLLLHDVIKPPANLTPAMIEALSLMSTGYRHTAAALELGISESALKARLTSARLRLDAQTTAEAVTRAREYGFL